jgi:hypothetical protein
MLFAFQICEISEFGTLLDIKYQFFLKPINNILEKLDEK